MKKVIFMTVLVLLSWLAVAEERCLNFGKSKSEKYNQTEDMLVTELDDYRAYMKKIVKKYYPGRESFLNDRVLLIGVDKNNCMRGTNILASTWPCTIRHNDCPTEDGVFIIFNLDLLKDGLSDVQMERVMVHELAHAVICKSAPKHNIPEWNAEYNRILSNYNLDIHNY